MDIPCFFVKRLVAAGQARIQSVTAHSLACLFRCCSSGIQLTLPCLSHLGKAACYDAGIDRFITCKVDQIVEFGTGLHPVDGIRHGSPPSKLSIKLLLRLAGAPER